MDQSCLVTLQFLRQLSRPVANGLHGLAQTLSNAALATNKLGGDFRTIP
jgi:hypothetical protein